MTYRCGPTLAVLAALLAGCTGATSQLQPVAEPHPSPLSMGTAPAPLQLTEVPEADSAVVGYRSEEPARDSVPEDAEETEEALRWTTTLMSSVDLRRSVDDVQRLRIIDELQEVRPGLLNGTVGPGFGLSSTEYNLTRLLRAYKSTVGWDPEASIVLWRGDRQMGRFATGGLFLTPQRP